LALYRFALLLKGGEVSARRVLLEMLSESAPRLAQLRNDRSRLAFALKKLREQCMKNGAPAGGENVEETITSRFAAAFSLLPEPGRSALALLYLKLFSAGENAALLDLSFDDFSAALQKARAILRETGQESGALPSQP